MPRRATAPLPPTELLREFFDYDPKTGSLIWRRREPHHFASPRLCKSWNGTFAGEPAGWTNANGYLATKINQISFLVQRIIWKLMTDQEPPEQIDHIDGDRKNNRWENFRKIDPVESAQNRGLHKNNKSGFRGVSQRGNSYIARIYPRGEYIYLGNFSTAEAASEAYETKAKELYGEFYRKILHKSTDAPT